MDTNFWLERWQTNQISFHENQGNALLAANIDTLCHKQGERVFLPLCGKTHDIAWLLAKGYRVAGVELSELAIKQLFDSLKVEPKITRAGNLKHYSAETLDIFCGDIFELDETILGTVDAVYDRAALVALPDTMRKQYSKHIIAMTGKARQLLITFDYDQNLMPGPPFSISSSEVSQHYAGNYEITLLESVAVNGGLKGICAADENAWQLAPK